MAARLSLDERVFIELSLGAGRGVADVAQRLGRDRSTVHRELARCADRAGYDARSAHASACAEGATRSGLQAGRRPLSILTFR
ncbi:helix-turn-helix domain-containing protein [Candidatus Poriferisodalis sp.]|uniref:helix-turn-helix domain-containing protein n=1 Tax=Candidatus Poriferisodalis sp. TaxID=3101277 RepID=UPI003B51E99A